MGIRVVSFHLKSSKFTVNRKARMDLQNETMKIKVYLIFTKERKAEQIFRKKTHERGKTSTDVL